MDFFSEAVINYPIIYVIFLIVVLLEILHVSSKVADSTLNDWGDNTLVKKLISSLLSLPIIFLFLIFFNLQSFLWIIVLMFICSFLFLIYTTRNRREVWRLYAFYFVALALSIFGTLFGIAIVWHVIKLVVSALGL